LWCSDLGREECVDISLNLSGNRSSGRMSGAGSHPLKVNFDVGFGSGCSLGNLNVRSLETLEH
jgi:hypothetical protein